MRRHTVLAVVVAALAALLAAHAATGTSVLSRARVRFLRGAAPGTAMLEELAGGAAACPGDGCSSSSDACSAEERSSTCCSPSSGQCCSEDSASCEDDSEESSEDESSEESEESSEESSGEGGLPELPDDEDEESSEEGSEESSEESSESSDACPVCRKRCADKGPKKDACYKQMMRQLARDRKEPALDQLTVVPVAVPEEAKLDPSYTDAIIRRRKWRRDCDLNRAEGKPCKPMKYTDDKEAAAVAAFLELPPCAALQRFEECSSEACRAQASACARAHAEARSGPVVPRTVPSGSLSPAPAAPKKLVPATVSASKTGSGPCPEHVKAATCCQHAAQSCCSRPCDAPKSSKCDGKDSCSDIQVQ